MEASRKAVDNLTYLVARAMSRKYAIDTDVIYQDLVSSLDSVSVHANVTEVTRAMNLFMDSLETDTSIAYPEDAKETFAQRILSYLGLDAPQNATPDAAPAPAIMPAVAPA